MKTSWTALLATLVVLVLDPVTATCKSACQSQLVHFREEACQKWRDQLPRPDLFNHCGQGFNKGKAAGCEGFCEAKPDLGVMKSLRLQACSSLKGVPPMERQQACQAGFSEALDLAKNAAVPDSEQETTQAASSQAAQGSQDTQDAGTAAGEPKKVRVKKVIEPERKNLLDEARKQSQEAFEEVKAEL